MTYYVYAMGPENSSTVKIGFTNNLETRRKTIQTGHPEKIVIHHFIELDTEKKMRQIEKKLHETLRHLRNRGEWFNISPENAKLELDYAIILNS
jgi:predicted GIY-YIG superfamily endonuclease